MDATQNNTTPWDKVARLIQIIIFLCIILAPIAAMLTSNMADISHSEKRELSKMPDYSWDREQLKAYPKEFEAYFNDHFGLRSTLIQLYSFMSVSVFNKSTSDRVVLGSDGWYFYGSKLSLNNYLGKNKFSDGWLKLSKSIFESRSEWLAKSNVKYLLVVAPDKYSIYRENLPTYLRQNNETTLLDQLTDYLGENSDFEIIDLRSSLIKKKKQSQVYYKTGTHWNATGAFVAYQQIMNRVKDSFPDVHMLSTNDLKKISQPPITRDLAKMLGLGGLNREEIIDLQLSGESCAKIIPWSYEINKEHPVNMQPIETLCDKAGLPTAVMFADSFTITTQLNRYLSESFSRIIYLPEKYDRQEVERWIQQIKPDYFIEEIVEREFKAAIMRGR